MVGTPREIRLQELLNDEKKADLSKHSIGIIGAGATGLTAAYRLLQSGVGQVSVYERSDRLGGLAATFPLNGEELELGYHHWYTSDKSILNLVEELGLTDTLRWNETTVGMLYDGTLYPFTSPGDLLRFSPLSIVSRVRMGVATLWVQQMDLSMFENITAAQWLRGWVGKSAYEKVWGPMLRGKFGEKYYEQVTMAWVWSKLNTRVKSRESDMLLEKLGYPLGGFGKVFETLAQAVQDKGGEIYTSTQVDRIMLDEETSPVLKLRHPEAEPDETIAMEHDAILATMPSPVFMRVADAGLSEFYKQKLLNTPYMTADVVILVMKRPLSGFYWINVADRSLPFVGVIEHTNLIGPENYSGKHIVYLTNYFEHDDPKLDKSDRDVLREFVPHLAQINPDFDPDWVTAYHRFKLPGAQPIIGVDYREKMPGHRTTMGGVYLANTSQIYPEDRGTNYSVRMGETVAQMMVDDLSTEEVDWPSDQ